MSSAGTEFTIRKKVFSLLDQKFHVFNAQEQVIGFCKKKAFKLKEDIRIYTDESMSRELLRIGARAVLDFSAAYDVFDSSSNTKIGALQRQGLQSMVRDSWRVLDESDREIGRIVEDSMAMALVRRLVPMANLIPQKYELRQGDNGHALAQYKTHFNPFIYRLTVNVPASCPINPYLVLSGGILLAAIEGRQQQ